MNLKGLHLFFLALVLVLGSSTVVFSDDSVIVEKFVVASATYNEPGKRSIIKKNEDKIPAVINALFSEAVSPETSKEDREAIFNAIERMATTYGDVTGKRELLRSVNKRIVESRLGTPVRDNSNAKVHVLESVMTNDGVSSFKPDNIVIKMGDTIRWVNSGDKDQQLSSILPGVGRSGILTPRIESGQSWEQTFVRPGDYYYMSLAGKALYGKITVVYE